MSAPAILQSDPLPVAPPHLSVPPYAAPAVAHTAVAGPKGRVAPYVPAAWRRTQTVTEPSEPALAASTPSPVVSASPGGALEVPARIPPYSPLRPTPMSVPAMRTPLYIPSIKRPESEAVIADEGEIEPALVHTTEFAVPPAPTPVESNAVDAELPWIDAFLAATPAASVPAVAENRQTPPGDGALMEVEEAPRIAHMGGADAVSPTVADTADEWPLEEAAAEFHALSRQLEPPAPQEPDALFAESVGLPPLPAWSDDEFMDIMPVHSTSRGVTADPAPVAPSASPSIEASAEEAARALEVLARRVRDGELVLPGYDPRMGEPAALVAALAALLGVRLR